MCHHLQSVSHAAKFRKSMGKKLRQPSHTGCIISENRFWFWADKEKKIDCIMDIYIVKYVFSEIRYTRIWRADFTTVSLQNYYLVFITHMLLFDQLSLTSCRARHLKSKQSWHLYLYSISKRNLWPTLSSPWRL